MDSIKGSAKRSLFEEWEFEFNRVLGQSCLSELEAECECPKWKWEQKVLREAGNEYRPPPPSCQPPREAGEAPVATVPSCNSGKERQASQAAQAGPHLCKGGANRRRRRQAAEP